MRPPLQPRLHNTEQTTFVTPEEAGLALRSAAQANDEAALAQILGSESKAILSSGDPKEDKVALASFVSKYDRMNPLGQDDRWQQSSLHRGRQLSLTRFLLCTKCIVARWYFDTDAGKNEILARRIGKNELLAIDAVYAMGNAEELYSKHTHTTSENSHQYTQKILSNMGKQDGLYWEVTKDEPSSPLGRLDEFAKDVVSSTQPGVPPVFDGYSFRVLTAQGNRRKRWRYELSGGWRNGRRFRNSGNVQSYMEIPAS